MAAMALTYAEQKSLPMWRPRDIDTILETGDLLYKRSYDISDKQSVHLAADHIIRHITLNEQHFEITCVPDTTLIGQFDHLTFGVQLSSFFQKYEKGVLTYNQKSIALIKDANRRQENSKPIYAIFDSHGSSMFPDKAVLIMFNTTHQLISWFYRNLIEQGTYSIVPISVDGCAENTIRDVSIKLSER